MFNQEEIEAKIGKSDRLFMGIKNSLPPAEGSNSVCFATTIHCIKALQGIEGCATNVPEGGNVGGYVASGEDQKATWFTVFKTVDIENGQVGVYPVSFQIAGAKPDTYLMELSVLNSPSLQDCEKAKGEEFVDFQKKQFFIVLS